MADGQGFVINPTGVTDFSTKLKSNIDKEMPAVDDIRQTLRWSPMFGQQTGSPAVYHAATVYTQQVNDGLALLDALIHNAGVMAQAATDVVHAYKLGDEISASELQEVLGGASTTVTQAADAAALEKAKQERAARQADLDERRLMHQHRTIS